MWILCTAQPTASFHRFLHQSMIMYFTVIKLGLPRTTMRMPGGVPPGAGGRRRLISSYSRVRLNHWQTQGRELVINDISDVVPEVRSRLLFLNHIKRTGCARRWTTFTNVLAKRAFICVVISLLDILSIGCFRGAGGP